MFKFDFDIEDAEDTEEVLGITSTDFAKQASEETSPVLEPFSELSIQQLLDTVPQVISYSPIHIPISSSRKATTLVRRDLFDARFQLISEGAGDAVEGTQQPNEEESSIAQITTDRNALEFLDAPSDLVPGVYEGGLKTWECSLDLVDHLDSLKDGENFSNFVGKKILDLGCGTGVPSTYVFRELLDVLESNKKTTASTEIHLQDYNASVLQLVTLPNVLLTWCKYTSIHADPYRYQTNDSDIAPTIDLTTPGELTITPELKTAFLETLESLSITLRFFSGSWDTFDSLHTAGTTGYNVLLTSETIYRTGSLESLVNLMESACVGSSLETLVSSLKLEGSNASKDSDYLCLVAAKVLYFGVGGGISDFLSQVQNRKGRVETVLERTTGVGRKVMRVYWP